MTVYFKINVLLFIVFKIIFTENVKFTKMGNFTYSILWYKISKGILWYKIP